MRRALTVLVVAGLWPIVRLFEILEGRQMAAEDSSLRKDGE